MSNERMMTCGEAAHRLRYSRGDTFRRWAKKSGFPLVRLSQTQVLVRESDIERELERRTVAKAEILAALRGIGLTRDDSARIVENE